MGTMTIEKKQATYNLEVLPHLEVLSNYALRLTGDREEANDLLQETCLKAFRFFESFKPGTNCRAWLYRIMKNSFINRYRRVRNRPDEVDYDDVKEFYHTIRPDGEQGNDFEQEVFQPLLGDDVIRAVNNLPADFRTVVILSDLEDCTYEEIAEFVDCPIGTVRSRLHRGRRLLREHLAEYRVSEGYARTG